MGTDEGIINDVEQQEPRHTAPTNDELVKRIESSEAVPMIGGRRDGSMFCRVVRLNDGYAYRPWGSDSSEAWEWLRIEDFERSFVAYGIVNMHAIKAVIHELVIGGAKWQARFRQAIAAMGPKSRKRLGNEILDVYKGNTKTK